MKKLTYPRLFFNLNMGLFSNIKSIYILTLSLLLTGFTGFSERVMEKVIEIPWNTEGGCKVEKLPSGNYGISSFQIISENELAVLGETEI